MPSDDMLRLATERLVAQFAPERVIIFGSQARGTADHHSDVDLLVICPITGNRRAIRIAEQVRQVVRQALMQEGLALPDDALQ